MNEKIILGIVASGGGTDFEAIVTGWENGQIPNVSKIILFGTKPDAGCFSKANAHRVESVLLECLDKNQVALLNSNLKQERGTRGIDMLFLAGCVWEIDTRGLRCPVFNIHPADTKAHGGRHMYGLAPHRHVLAQIRDELYREVRSVTDSFFTEIDVHQVRSEDKVDGGKVINRLYVPIPPGIIMNLTEIDDINFLAGILQKHILQYEHLILPSAINILAQMCLDKNK